MEYSLPGSSVHRIFQARVLEWVVISYSVGLPNPDIEPTSLVSPTLTARFFMTTPHGKSKNTHTANKNAMNKIPISHFFKY